MPFVNRNNNNSPYGKDNTNNNEEDRDTLSQISGISFNSGEGLSQKSSRHNTLERKRYQPEKSLVVPEVGINTYIQYKEHGSQNFLANC